MKRVALASLVVGAAVTVAPAAAAQSGDCGSDEYSLGCVADDPPAPPKPQRVITEPPGGDALRVTYETVPLRWTRLHVVGLPVDPPPCRRTFETADLITIEHGAVWVVTVARVDTGAILTVYTYCEWPGGEPPAPPPPPMPPGEYDSETKEPLRLETSLSPPADGIGGVSQLETWFWCRDPGPVDVEARTSASRSQAHVTAAAMVSTVSGPDGTIVLDPADDCGAAPDPGSDGTGAAARWTPNLPGDYTITLSTSWEGTWYAQLFLTGVGWITYGPFVLAPIVVVSEPITYHVIEIQTVGVGADR